MGPSHVPLEIKGICPSSACMSLSTQELSSEDLTQSLPQARANGDLA